MRHFIIFISLMMICSTAYGLGRDVSFEEIMKYHSNETEVKTCGSWKYDGKEGFYRITHAFVNEWNQSFLYVQWMKKNDQKPLYTLSFAEFNNDHAEVTLSHLQCIKLKEGITIKAHAESGHEDKPYRITIHIANQPGKYQLIEKIMM